VGLDKPHWWRLVDERIDATHLPRIRAARVPLPASRPGPPVLPPDRDCWLHLDLDATIPVDHSDNKGKTASGDLEGDVRVFTRCWLFLDRPGPSPAGGGTWAGLLRKGNARSNCHR